MKILKVENNNLEEIIDQASEVLSKGGILVYPTETCYGVGVDCTNPKAVENVLNYKSRPQGKPISIAINSREMALEYVEISESAENMYKNFLPGPITVISRSKNKAITSLQSESGTLGIRFPDHIVPLKLVEKFGTPITSTSANTAGKPSPYSIESLLEHLPKSKQDMIDLIIDFGELPKNPPSTVVDTTLAELNIIREGAISFDGYDESFEITDEKEIQQLTQKVMNEMQEDQPLLLLMNGPMGAGKTHFTIDLARELGIKDRIKSPTYTIMHEHKFGQDKKLIHIDTWRLDMVDDIKSLKLKDLMQPGNILVVEWANKYLEYLKELAQATNAKVLNVFILIKGPNEREIKYSIIDLD